ncbi:peptidase domain-containing ABC transporter [Sporohalobacter salinus]|uniref:peptidase domain-containing ABC transporter n=1 Tax=Sporohalobacter salinus TaxID=1494606 RepID=UPI001961EE90|nr:type I secretion system permease/ATPase [Sporohalobacter salinus]MBM7623237.1 subfamily B ATP-binding cassette protein HlyB/CyaB [Sporohalobacter salinus]
MGEEPNKKTLRSFIIIAKLNHISLNENQLDHRFALEDKDMTEKDLLRISKKVGLKAKSKTTNYDKILELPKPMLVENTDGKFIVLAKANEDEVLILDPDKKKSEKYSKDEFIEDWTGKVILVKDKDMRLENIKFGLKWFIPSILKYKKSFINVLIAAFTLQIIGLVSPFIIQTVIDKVLVHKAFTTLKVLMIGLFITIAFELFLSLARKYVFTHTTNRIDVILSSRVFNHLFKLPLSYFENRKVGVTISRVRQVENIRRFLTGAPLSTILDTLFLVVYIVVMYIYSTTLANIVMLSLPFFILVAAVITPLFKNNLKEKFRYGAEMQNFLVESVSGVKTIKSFALEPLSQKRWEDKVSDYVGASFKTSIIGGVSSAVSKFIQRTADMIILWVGAHLVISGEISVGQLVAFRMLSGRVSRPILRLVNLWQEFQQTSVSIERLSDIFNAEPEPHSDMEKAKLPQIKGQVEFENVTFRYRNDMPEVIRNMSFKVPAGKTIGVVGRSGSGKSTLTKLIQRLYIPEQGKIMIDGVDLSLADPYWLRRQIGIVLQESFLFNGSIKYNISVHKPGASLEEIVHCAKIAGAHEFILELPQGYDTQVGERGTSLSGGQRQRIAIARALLTDPPILIFDEATSSLDYESEKVVQQNLNRICQGRTVFIIAHRLSTTRDADAIMVLDKGNLKEFGSHRDLMNKEGLYHYLYTQQHKGEGDY